MEFVDQAFGYLQTGYAQMNAPLGILIAIVLAYQMGDFKQVFRQGLIGTIAYAVLQVLMPVLANTGAGLQLPPDLLTQNYWINLVTVFLAMVLMILVFFTVKRTVLKGAH
jgi:hypothetical protein